MTIQNTKKLIRVAGWLIIAANLSCSSPGYRFRDTGPVTIHDDKQPIPVPESSEYIRRKNEINVLVGRPAVQIFDVSRVSPAQDCNALDDIPASSWYTPRLGYRKITPEELVKGPYEAGPPQSPVKVTKAKSGGGNPGFVIEDGRGFKYLVKFDPPDFPGMETTTAFIVNRLFHGFGYNTPEDYLYFFRREDMGIDPDGELTQQDVDAVLEQVAVPVNGRYRSTVSLYIKGTILGPTIAFGTREDDPNDTIRHENRRILRALRVFCAFTNNTGMRIDNSLDVYEGEPDNGYVKHYLLDFGEAFGGHGTGHDYRWDGYNHIFDFRQTMRNLLTFGLFVEDWENAGITPWKSVGRFESAVFNPEKWNEVWPYEPIRRSQPADDYWAAKVLASLTREHIAALVHAAEYPEPEAADYIIKTLMERRRKILNFAFNNVSPLEVVNFGNGILKLKDFGKTIPDKTGVPRRYEIRYYDGSGKELHGKHTITGNGDSIDIPIKENLVKRADDYLRIDVWVWRGKKCAPSPAEFHVRKGDQSLYNLVGVVH
ncbi:hypothetical protein ACFL60_04885 [Candidatus Omnitrophota bacterium]